MFVDLKESRVGKISKAGKEKCVEKLKILIKINGNIVKV